MLKDVSEPLSASYKCSTNFKYETLSYFAQEHKNLPSSLTCTSLSRIDGIYSIAVSAHCGISSATFSGKTVSLWYYNPYGWDTGCTITIVVFQNGN